MPKILNLVTLLNKSSFFDLDVRFLLERMKTELFWRLARRLRGWLHLFLPTLILPISTCVPLLSRTWELFSLFPFFPFSMEDTRVLNVELSQLFSNSWGCIKAFEMVCEGLVIILTVRVFFSFYTTKTAKGSWVSLSSQDGKSLFTSHSNHHKY